MSKIVLSCRVNGEERELLVKPWQTLLEALRDDLRLTGTKEGCSNGNCGSCTVIIDGRAVNSCLVLALEAQGRDILTIEGLGKPDKLDPVQQAFLDNHAVQCGFCTPGTVLTAKSLIDQREGKITEAEIRTALAGSLCRCTGYDKIVRAVAAVGQGHNVSKTAGPGPKYVGISAPRVDGPDKVTGKSRYSADIYLSGMLYTAILRSPHPHAWIKSIDVSKAAALPGVKAVITAKDLPRPGKMTQAFGAEGFLNIYNLRKLILADEKVFFHGQAVAAVAATEREIADAAMKLINVEYEALPYVLDADKAMEPGAPLLHSNLLPTTLAAKGGEPGNISAHTEIGWGDVEKAFEKADVVVETAYQTQVVTHASLEPLACVASAEPGGQVTVWTSTQGIFNCQRQLSALLELPQDKLTIIPTEVGGAFGGRTTVQIEPLAALLSQKTGRPVKMVLKRDEVFRAGGAGAPAYIRVKVGAKKDGHLVAGYARFVYDIGAFPGTPTPGGAIIAFGGYKLEDIKVESYNVVTNKLPVLMYRAPGGTVSSFAVETSIDILAEKLGLDPIAFRQLNAVSDGDPMFNGQPFRHVKLDTLLKRVSEHPAWTEKLEGTNRGRGLALGYWTGAVGPSTSSAWVYVHRDGSVTVTTGHVDLSGTRTALRQLAAQNLEIPIEKVSVHTTDTSSSPFSDQTVGSRTTVTYSIALHQACHHAISQMKAQAAHRLNVPNENIEYSQGQFRVKSSEQTISWDEVAHMSIRRLNGPVLGIGSTTTPHAPIFSVHVADVEVDPPTGKTKILRYTCFHDVGQAVNPALVEGQIQGGACQGIGWALTEGYDYGEGRLQNASFLDYRIPTAADVPSIDVNLIEEPSDIGPYGLRGVGEIPIVPVPAALANALYRACGVRFTRLPMTPEAVYRTIQRKEQEPWVV